MSRLLVGEGRLVDVLVPERPFNAGEIVLRPRRGAAAFEDLTGEEIEELSEWLARIEVAMEQVYNPQGMNIGFSSRYAPGAAGLELHVVPRWSGDMNFMPVVAGVKVLPATPDETVEVYRNALFGT